MTRSRWQPGIMRRMSTQDAVSLARDLLRFDTINPAGR